MSGHHDLATDHFIVMSFHPSNGITQDIQNFKAFVRTVPTNQI